MQSLSEVVSFGACVFHLRWVSSVRKRHGEGLNFRSGANDRMIFSKQMLSLPH